jgi:hypothetical protein
MLLIAGSLLVSNAALAEDYKCVSGERIEKGSSTWGKAVSANGDWRIEKGSSTVGWARKANGDWRIETAGGSTIGWLKGSRIESAGGSTRASLSDAKSLASCSDAVAAALWVLQHEGRL